MNSGNFKYTAFFESFRLLMPQFALLFIVTTTAFAQDNQIFKASAVKHPVYAPDTSHLGELKKSVEPLMQMTVPEVIGQVPVASGIFFVGCPNCDGGAQEMNVLGWKPGMDDKVRCNYCQMLFPNEKFPNNRETVIIAPSGTKQVYRYYQNAEGRQYFFEPHAWYERWSWINAKAAQLATLYYATADNAYGDRAAAIAGRFAQVFPDYAVRYDYPNAPVKFYPANQKWPHEGVPPYRGAKWRWWGYDDIPTELMEVYDVLKAGYDWKRMDKFIGAQTDTRISRDLLRLGYEFTTANPEVYSNKSPGMYSQMIRVGRILGDPIMVHEAVKRFREFFSRGFFPDGWWKEGTTGYHHMTINGLKTVAEALNGYVDPEGWKGERLDHPDLTVEVPLFKKALQVNSEAILPNGRELAINDTWGYLQRTKTDQTVSRLWPALGNAAMGTGKGDNQVMLNLNWSGNYGHSHYDNGSIILYAAGEELLSDLGYTHTKYRGWTLHTASHNTIVIDQKGQNVGTDEKPATGQLQFYDDKDLHVKAIDVDASPAYSAASSYRRRLIMVHAAEGRDYVIDRFDVAGGQDHDWFLHGAAEQQGTLETSIPLDRPVNSLVPAWAKGNLPKLQDDVNEKRFHPYAQLHDIKGGAASQQWTATWKYNGGSALRTHIISEDGTRVYRFHSSSVRLAREDANKLDDFQRNGLMQRHSGGKSSFLAVHEPFRKNTWIESVKKDGTAMIVNYTLDGKPVQDRINFYGDEIEVISTAGWSYRSGKPVTGLIKALEAVDGKYSLRADRTFHDISYIRLDLAPGITRYYPVSKVNGEWLELNDDPGFTIEPGSGKLKYHSFPQEEYPGPLRYTVFVK